jgi:hypothetical protein
MIYTYQILYRLVQAFKRWQNGIHREQGDFISPLLFFIFKIRKAGKNLPFGMWYYGVFEDVYPTLSMMWLRTESKLMFHEFVYPFLLHLMFVEVGTDTQSLFIALSLWRHKRSESKLTDCQNIVSNSRFIDLDKVRVCGFRLCRDLC